MVQAAVGWLRQMDGSFDWQTLMRLKAFDSQGAKVSMVRVPENMA